ncbi:kinase-like domain-containing protein [Boletus reticuloceps]|uniref:non-specific serine/threonine protein kinase n=1 Tax=Boletus reticuloceps TaxID=495285 RepID=A0A8I3A985_9AGAM|nr:kinase-like domain-containing protein [Boletus reticuloceps]
MGCSVSQPVDFESEVNLFHFELHRAVGKGAFGKVRVVEHKKTKQVYALKYIDKSKCVKQRAVANTIQERHLLEEVDHPFIVNLRYAFQDDENCFFVLDLMLGGDLRFHLERRGNLSEHIVRFWMAELASALVYLHKRRIIHRDIKPDNILLDAQGHAHITDFNVAIHYSERRLHTSVAGSMAYMAPEVIGRKGYTWCIDWWSLGITAFELLFSYRPFDGRTAERMRKSIMNDTLKFPDDVSRKYSSQGINFIQGLLERTVSQRLGCKPRGAGFQDIKDHPWMSGVDWNLLSSKSAQPPFVPDAKRANFDVSHELDEFLMVEKPLTHSKRKANPNLDKMKPEFRQLEEEFTVYDFMSSQRRSYYPHNQPVVTVARSSESPERDHLAATQSQTNTIQPTATIAERTLAERSLAGSPIPGATRDIPLVATFSGYP